MSGEASGAEASEVLVVVTCVTGIDSTRGRGTCAGPNRDVFLAALGVGTRDSRRLLPWQNVSIDAEGHLALVIQLHVELEMSLRRQLRGEWAPARIASPEDCLHAPHPPRRADPRISCKS